MVKDKKPSRTSIIIIIVVAALLVAAVAGFIIYSVFGPVSTRVELGTYLGLIGDNEYAVTVNGLDTGSVAVRQEETVYLPLDLVVESVDERYFYDASLGEVLYALPQQLVSLKPGEKAYSVDGTAMECAYAPFILSGDTKYIAEPFVRELGGASVTINDDARTVVVWSALSETTLSVTKTVATDKTQLRTLASDRSTIVTDVAAGDTIYVQEAGEEWTKACTESGLTGYIKNSCLSEYAGPVVIENEHKYEYTSISQDTPVVCVWHQVTSNDYDAQIEAMKERLAQTKGVNVISPTWYSLAGEEGTFTTLASKEYVDAAHELGLKVWALVDNFNTDVDDYVFLNNYEARQKFINGIVGEAVTYGFDGINLDFEASGSGYGGISKTCAEGYLELIRELSIKCRLAGLVLSVDDHVPASFNAYFDRAEQGRIVDYVIVMGYDEHYAGSEAGSVASYDFVKAGIEDTLAEVPAGKVINAIPFYTRLWAVDDGGAVIASEAKNMSYMNDMLTAAGAEKVWLDDVKQYYSEFTADGQKYEVWLETAESIQWKIDLINENHLAGVACWKLGLETSDVWSVIKLDGQN